MERMKKTENYLAQRGIKWERKTLHPEKELYEKLLIATKDLTKEDVLKDFSHTRNVLSILFGTCGEGSVADQAKFINFLGMPKNKWLLPAELVKSIHFEYRDVDNFFYFTYALTEDTKAIENHLCAIDRIYAFKRTFRKDVFESFDQLENFKNQIAEWMDDWEKRYNFVRTFHQEMMEFIWEDIQQLKK